MKGKAGIYPCPVYEAHFADGTVGRCSFYSPVGKPIDFEHGRRVAAILWARPEGDSGLVIGPSYVKACHDWRDETTFTPANSEDGFPYSAVWFVEGRGLVIGLKTFPPRADIVAGFIEHETIGRVAHDTDAPVRIAPRHNKARALAESALAALERGDAADALAILRRIAA